MSLRSKSLLATAAAAGLATFCIPSQARATLMLYWDFDHTSGGGTTINDQSGNGHTGTYNGTTGAPTVTVPPLTSSTPTTVGNFDGSSQAVTSTWTASNLGIGGNNPRSVSVWVNAASASWTGSQQQGGVFEVGADSNGNDFSLRVKGTSDTGNPNDWRAQFWGGDTDFTVANSADHWTHFVLVYDPAKTTYTDHTVNIFANGVRVATGDETLNTLDAPKTFAVGEWHNNATPKFLQGQIDDVAVYNSVLTQAQITALAAGASPTTVPEPAALGLTGVAGLLFLRRRRVKA